MNCSRRTTYFHCRIVFHTRIVPGTPRISVQDRFSTRVVDDLFRAHHIVSLQDRFSTRWIYRSAKIYHLRIVFQRDELFQARITYFHCRIAFLRILESTRWIVPGARRISTAGSFFIQELFQAHHIVSLQDRFSTVVHDELFQAHKNIPFQAIVLLRDELFLNQGSLASTTQTEIYHLRIA